MSSHLVPSSESDSSDHDNDYTSLNLFHKLHKCTRLFTEHQTDETSRLNTSLQSSTYSNEINVSNATVSTLPQVSNNILKDNQRHSIDHDEHDDIEKNLNINAPQGTNNIIDCNHSINKPTINAKIIRTTSDALMTMPNKSQIQTTINQYFSPIQSSFEEIINLEENRSNFRIRCKIICKFPIRYFGNANKVFDGIICDRSGEAKIVAFNENVDKFYDIIIVNNTIKIENAKIELAKENFRSTYSTYQIRLLSDTIVEPYNSLDFKPSMKIDRELLINIPQKLHGSIVDVQGQVVLDQKVKTTISQNNGQLIRRKIIKIKDQTSTATVTIWSNKIDDLPDRIMNKTLRIRNGRINHYSDYVTINASEQTMIDIID